MSKLGEIAMAGKTLPGLNKREQVVLSRIADCHTQRMGGNTLICECGHKETHYNSCRDRHCPLCQGAARARWVEERLNELLPVSYFHVVFTVPHELLSLAQANHRLFYKALFSSVHNTLKAVCMNPENLGALIGGMTVLHTWTQKLTYHPHVHCIIPGGGISSDKSRWIEGNAKYLVSVKRLSVVFRGKLLSILRKYCDGGDLFGDRVIYEKALIKASRKSFVVYAKKPFGGPAQVVKYLGRYTHRVGISEQRIITVDENKVCFTWVDRTSGHKKKKLTLPLQEFVNRFLLHLLPKGMRKIRYFGYMSNRNRQKSITQVRQLIWDMPGFIKEEPETHISEIESHEEEKILDFENKICCKCGKEMSIFGLNESRQNIHGPEPNSLVAC